MVQHDAAHEVHHEAMVRAKTTPRLHVPRHIPSGEIKTMVNGDSSVGQFNNMLAGIVTRGVGTMWAAYVFVLISLVSFPQALNSVLNGGTGTGSAWVSQSFL